jgi:hypothetical protein
MWSAMLFCITVSKHLSRVLAAVTGPNGKDLWGGCCRLHCPMQQWPLKQVRNTNSNYWVRWTICGHDIREFVGAANDSCRGCRVLQGVPKNRVTGPCRSDLTENGTLAAFHVVRNSPCVVELAF